MRFKYSMSEIYEREIKEFIAKRLKEEEEAKQKILVPQKAQVKIESPRSQDELKMEALMKAFRQSPSFPQASLLILKICTNIVRQPKEEKYRWVKLSNPKVRKANLMQNKASKQVLDYMGFTLCKNKQGEDCINFPLRMNITNLKGKLLFYEKYCV